MEKKKHARIIIKGGAVKKKNLWLTGCLPVTPKWIVPKENHQLSQCPGIRSPDYGNHGCTHPQDGKIDGEWRFLRFSETSRYLQQWFGMIFTHWANLSLSVFTQVIKIYKYVTYESFAMNTSFSLYNSAMSLEDTYFKQLTPDPNFCG